MAIFKEKIQNQYFRMPVEYVRNKGFTLKEIGLLALLTSGNMEVQSGGIDKNSE